MIVSSISGQSAIEYLMTYGWMLLVVAVAGGAIFSLANPEGLESVSGFEGETVLVEDFGTNFQDELQLVLLNRGTETVEIQEIRINDSENEVVWRGPREVEVGDSDVFTFLQVVEGDSAENLDVELTYDDGTFTGIQSEGSISGRLEVKEDSLLYGMDPLALKVNSSKDGETEDNEFEIPARGNVNYQVEWENKNTGTTERVADPLTDDHVLEFEEPGVHTVEIRGILSHLRFSSGVDEEKVIGLESWGEVEWTSMNGAFRGTSNMDANYDDVPDISRVSSMSAAFRGSSFNGDVGGWNTSSVERMDNAFRGASNFEGDGVEDWDVSSVRRMLRTFNGASSFNGDVSDWDVSNVGKVSTAMHRMFHNAEEFDQDISEWNTSRVDNMTWMFRGSTFDRDISDWCVEEIDEEPGVFGVSEENQPDWGEPC